MKVKYLSELLSTINLVGTINSPPEMPIRHICYDSRNANPGSLFVAIRGFKFDGHDYLDQARVAGAVAAIVEEPDRSVPLPQYVVKDSRIALSQIAANFYRPEIDNLRLVGITGTNGKTTSSYLIRSILDAAGVRSGLIGTIAYFTGEKITKAWNTPPESADLYKMLYNMAITDVRGCVVEVSSHALQLHRVDNLKFEVGVFTNLTQDHLDFHRDMEDYFNAKSLLFKHVLPGGHAVINADDAYGQRLLSQLNLNSLTFAIKNKAQVTVQNWTSTLNGIYVQIESAWGQLDIQSPLIGEFNVENILAAVSTGLVMNFDIKTIINGIESVHSVPGRLEPIQTKDKRSIIVDYAHTPDALQKSLSVLRKLSSGAIWVVFGCGGDRDKAKRPIMGQIASDYADFLIVTSDNPRSENPNRIIQDILSGISDKNNVVVEEDRRLAIAYALKNSQEADTILIAGKGHEDYQEIQGVKHPFDDRLVVKEITG
jgi:UDP-N-acetylmuramoyl-L-alanyl-D-glutamate--2,6-diaminopimelate ligase